MATRLESLLNPLTPALDRALQGEGVHVPTPGGALRIRERSSEPRAREASAAHPPPPARPPGPAPSPEPPHPSLRRDRAEEVVIGFRRRAPAPPPEPEAPPEPSAAPPERAGIRTISVSRDEPTRKQRQVQEEVTRRVPFDRVREVLAMAPGGAASASELGAWFGVAAKPLEAVLRGWCDAGQLTEAGGERYRLAEAEAER